MKICWITLCYNEMDILPFVRKYWERIADTVVVYDNGSTDGSVEYLQSLQYVELKHFDSAGQNDAIQKTVKEKAYLEYKDQYDVIIISDMDELFYFSDFGAVGQQMIDGGYNCLCVPNYGLCEDYKPIYDDNILLHQQCHKFYKQRLNHMLGLDNMSKISIFNTNVTNKISLSVGQHYVVTSPKMMIMMSNNGFCLHVDKGLSENFYVEKRKKMAKNLSETNKRYGMCVEYMKTEEESRKEYKEHQAESFDLNAMLH